MSVARQTGLPASLRFAVVLLGVGVLTAFPTRECSAQRIPPEARAAIDRGVGFLRAQLTKHANGSVGGETALAAYAMIKGKVKVNDPVVSRVVNGVLKKFDAKGNYKGYGIYVAGVDMMLLEAAAKKTAKYNNQLQAITDYIVKTQNNQGFWNYLGSDEHGDTSVTQYGALGLWAASRAGIKVPPQTWDKMAGWLIRSQINTGGWRYRPTSPGVEGETQSMTVAGAASLFVAAMHLYPAKMEALAKREAAEKKKKKRERRIQDVNLEYSEKEKKAGKVAIPYSARNSFERIRGSARRGLAWSNNAARRGIAIGEWSMYTAYGVERLASLANIKNLGGRDWYQAGLQQLLKSQAKDGSWSGKASKIPATAFGILFLSKATAATLGRIDEYGAGLLRGNSGLPDNLDELELDEDGKIKKVEQFKEGPDAVIGLFSDLGKLKPKDAPKADAFVKAFQNLKRKDREEFLKKKHRQTVLKLIEHPQPIPRSIGIWVLGRTGDIQHVKLLINALENDPDLDVAIEARNALCWISRKPRGFGLESNPKLGLADGLSKQQRAEALQKWRDKAVKHWKKWYFTVRPYDERDDLSETPDTFKN